MFESKIENTQLAGTLADCMFRRVSGCDYQGDVSFISTLRALLMDVDVPEPGVKFAVSGMPSGSAPEAISSSVASALEANNTITYVSVDTDLTAEEQGKERFFAFSAPDNAHEFEDVREFFASKMDCRAFICEANRSSAIVVRSTALSKHHLVQCILPKLLPWIFSGVQLSAAKRNLLYALRERKSVNYRRALDAMCDSDEFRSKVANAAIANIQRRSLMQKKDAVENEIRVSKDRIETHYSSIEQLYRNVANFEERLSGILIAMENPGSDEELTSFLASNPNIQIETKQLDNTLTFIIKGYLDVYDPEAYRTLSRNAASWYWNRGSVDTEPFIRKENRKLVLDAIFGENPQFKLKTFGVFRFDLNAKSVSACARYDENGGQIPANCFPNPHLYYASCLGSYRSHIMAALAKGDLVGAFSQCISSAHSVNVTESATFGILCRELFTRPGAFLESSDGTCYTVFQAYEWLVAQQTANNETSSAS